MGAPLCSTKVHWPSVSEKVICMVKILYFETSNLKVILNVPSRKIILFPKVVIEVI